MNRQVVGYHVRQTMSEAVRLLRAAGVVRSVERIAATGPGAMEARLVTAYGRAVLLTVAEARAESDPPDPGAVGQGETFRRLWAEHGNVMAETEDGVAWLLPGVYDARAVLKRVRAAGRIDLDKWQRAGD